jgi:uncharacterized protein
MKDEITGYLFKEYGEYVHSLTISRLVKGLHFTAVQLSDGSCGLAASEYTENAQHIHPHQRFYGAFAPGTFRGSRVSELLKFEEDARVSEAVKVAVINAVSSGIGYGESAQVHYADTLDVLDLTGKKNITIVGAFHNYIRRLTESGHELKVVELSKEALHPEHLRYFVAYSDSAPVLGQSDIVIMTGSSLVNRTFEHLLGMCGAQTQKVLAGPTGGMLPGFLFAKGIDIIGATSITDAEKMFSIIEEGGSGYHLFEACARKVCIVKKQI